MHIVHVGGRPARWFDRKSPLHCPLHLRAGATLPLTRELVPPDELLRVWPLLTTVTNGTEGKPKQAKEEKKEETEEDTEAVT